MLGLQQYRYNVIHKHGKSNPIHFISRYPANSYEKCENVAEDYNKTYQTHTHATRVQNTTLYSDSTTHIE